MRRFPIRLLSAFLPFLVVGCGQSQAAKEEAAVARMRNRSRSGFVRVVNLSGVALPVNAKGRPIMADVAPDQFSRLVAFASGKGVLSAGASEIAIDLKPGEGTSIVVFPSWGPEILPGDLRTPGTENVRIVVGKGDSSTSLPNGGIPVTGPSASKIGTSTTSLSLAPGDYKVGGASIKIEPKCAYTFLIVPFQKKLRVFPMLNTPNDRPAGAGAA